MKAGFGKVDITPRLGVELCGFGPFLHRGAERVREPLYARAMAASDGTRTCVVVSADLIGFSPDTVGEARRMVEEETGVPAECVMLHATHTHSGPATVRGLTGWGEPDEPYMTRLPRLLADSAVQAAGNLEEVEFRIARVPVEGIGYNRELEKRPEYDAALDDGWRPGRPECTDTAALVVSAWTGERLAGFFSSYSCHPVVCCEETQAIHGDFCGVATNMLEKEHPGSVGLFLQGASGDINSCVCHVPEDEALRALDVIAGRYAGGIRQGIEKGGPLGGASVAAALGEVTVPRQAVRRDDLAAEIEEQERVIRTDPDGDAGKKSRMATVRLLAARRILERLEAGRTLDSKSEVQALRVGDLLMFGLPFEVFGGIAERVRREIAHEPLLVLGTTNDYQGYAVPESAYEKPEFAAYAKETVPGIIGEAPLRAGLEDEIVDACRVLASRAVEGASA